MRLPLISAPILEKLASKHNVTRREVEQCFENRIGLFLEDDREDHRTDPPTLWFIAPTNCDRKLKVVFVYLDGNIHLKTAFDPSPEATAIYDRLGR